MALHKLSKSKTFHVDYCGCTAAALLLNDQAIRDAIDFIRQVKTKREFVKTTITLAKDGIKIIYNNEQNFSTIVPAAMIAGSTIGKSSLQDTIGVVYISPLTGDHYPAFVHVYRCESIRNAQKFLSRLRAYLLIESHRLRIVQLEQQLLARNLLNIDHYNAMKLAKNNTPISSSTTSSDSRKEIIPDQIKSITEEFQKKLDSNEPILFPPKDYDTVHVAHGHIQRAQAWKSTEPTIVGYSPIDPDDNRPRRHLQKSALSTTDTHQNNDIIENNNNEKLHSSTNRHDVTIDPVETVSLAFDFLKDETGSIFNDNDGNIEHVENQQSNKTPIYRFRPPQITAITKKLFTRNNNYELTNGASQSNSSSRNDVNNNPHKHHYQQQQPNHHQRHHHRYHPQQPLQNGHRSRSETRLYHDQQTNMHLSPRYESRLMNGSGAPITTNPLWSAVSSNIAGSQPNLLSHQSLADSDPLHHQHQRNSQMERPMPSTHLQHSLYSSYPDNKSGMITQQQENSQKRLVSGQPQYNRKQTTQSQYPDTNEFILRASNGQPLRNAQYPNQHIARDYRPHSINVNGSDDTMLDVYY